MTDIIIKTQANPAVIKTSGFGVSIKVEESPAVIKTEQNPVTLKIIESPVVIKTGLKGKDGEGLPAGGTTGQLAAKASNEDYDVEWVNSPTSEYSAAVFTNKTGGDTFVGGVYPFSEDGDASFVLAELDYQEALACVASSVIANNASGLMATVGIVEVYVNATTDRLDNLYFSSTSGQLLPSKERKEGIVAIALDSRTGAGLITAALIAQKNPINRTDEQTWQKHVILPVHGPAGTNGIIKYVNNPVIAKGGAGSWNENGTLQPGVLADYLRNLVMVYFVGTDSNASPAYLKNRIGLATVPLNNIESSHTQYGSNPIYSANVGWEIAGSSQGMFNPSPLYDIDAPNSGTDYKFKFFIVGCGGDATGVGIGYYYSNDGYSLTPYSGNPIINYSFGDGLNTYPSLSVMMLGRVIFLFYKNVAGNISCCYSITKGTSFINLGEVLIVGDPGEWDDDQMGDFKATHDSGIIYGTYYARDAPLGSGGKFQIGLSMNSLKDFLTDTILFKKYFLNPLVYNTNPNSGTWDNSAHFGPDHFFRNLTMWMWFSALSTTDYERQIGLAAIKKSG